MTDEPIDLDARRRRQEAQELNRRIRAQLEHGQRDRREAFEFIRQWEEANPGQAVRPGTKAEMVELGFVGRTAPYRCAQPHRVPMAEADPIEGRRLCPSEKLPEVVTCPAMEAGRCLGMWEALGLPPCRTLSVEIHHHLGARIFDLQEAMEPEPVLEEVRERTTLVRQRVAELDAMESER